MNFKRFEKIFNKGIKRNFKRGDYTVINYQTLQRMLKDCNNLVIIDVRSEQEYQEGHLQNAIVIPQYEIQVKVQKIVPDKNTKIVLYCQSGKRSKKAAKTLINLKYNNVYELEGGIENM